MLSASSPAPSGSAGIVDIPGAVGLGFRFRVPVLVVGGQFAIEPQVRGIIDDPETELRPAAVAGLDVVERERDRITLRDVVAVFVDDLHVAVDRSARPAGAGASLIVGQFVVDEQVELAGGERVVIERFLVAEVRGRAEAGPADATPIAPTPPRSCRLDSECICLSVMVGFPARCPRSNPPIRPGGAGLFHRGTPSYL